MKPSLSVIVVSFNTRDLLERCLASVAADPVGAGAEVWVVDNASSDGSPEMVKDRFPEVRLIVNGTNRGFAAACNQALARAAGELVLLLNSDTAVEAGALYHLCAVLEHHPEVGVVGGQLIGPDGRPERSYGRTPRVRSFLAEMIGVGRIPGLRRLLPEIASVPRRRESARAVDHVCGACLAFRRELLDVIGPLDERFFLYFEETDFCVRVRRDGGLLVWFEPRARIRHEGRCSARQLGREDAESHYARSAHAFVRKHHGPAAARRLGIAFGLWLAAQLIVHRTQAVLGRPGATETLARKRRLRRLHRSLARPRALRPCPCGEASSWPVRIGRIAGLRCEACGLLSRSEMPSEEAVVDWYRNGYWAHNAREDMGPGRAHVHRQVLRTLERFADPSGSLVDVGCGAGALLELCRRHGWEGTGFDLSPQAVAHARSLGLDVHERAWLSSELAAGETGVVTIVNTLDHLADPFAALDEARRVLRPGGVLYLRLPNATVHVRLMAPLSRIGLGGLPVFHLFGFGRRALVHHLPRLGFRVIVLRSAPPAAPAHPAAWGMRRLLGALNHLLYGLLTASRLDRRVLGSSIEVIAVREGGSVEQHARRSEVTSSLAPASVSGESRDGRCGS